ncbi:hypothetical protein IG631_17081 [Alternaria alternata]|nr:hypothetical protein IG631_17081 [Alternaria alternata]
MAATQQLSMQSRTGRVNQRKSAHETPTTRIEKLNPFRESPQTHRFNFRLIGGRLWVPRRAASRRCCPAFRRQVLRPPHPVHQAKRLGASKRRLGDGRGNGPRRRQTRSLGRGWHNMQDQLRPWPHP